MSTKIIKEVKFEDFKNTLSKNNIFVSNHALDHLSQAQRNIFKKEDLIKILTKEKPIKIGLQKNNRIAVFYRRKDYYIKIIIAIKRNKTEIITFINTTHIPHIIR